MVLKSRFLVVIPLGVLALALARPAGAADVPRPQEVVLPVKDYLALVEKGEAAEKDRLRREGSREAPVAEVTSQRVRVVLGDKDLAEVTADYEVLVQGEPKAPVILPVTGVPRSALVKTRVPGRPERRRGGGRVAADRAVSRALCGRDLGAGADVGRGGEPPQPWRPPRRRCR